MVYKCKQVDSEDHHFRSLVKALDAELAGYNGEKDEFYTQFNSIQYIKNAILVLDENDLPLACGAFKKYADDTVEIKRMYVHPDHRRHGLASTVLTQLERWAKELGFEYALLETGEFLSGTVAFYKKCGYSIIPNYDQYVGIDGSICFKKTL